MGHPDVGGQVDHLGQFVQEAVHCNNIERDQRFGYTLLSLVVVEKSDVFLHTVKSVHPANVCVALPIRPAHGDTHHIEAIVHQLPADIPGHDDTVGEDINKGIASFFISLKREVYSGWRNGSPPPPNMIRSAVRIKVFTFSRVSLLNMPFSCLVSGRWKFLLHMMQLELHFTVGSMMTDTGLEINRVRLSFISRRFTSLLRNDTLLT